VDGVPTADGLIRQLRAQGRVCVEDPSPAVRAAWRRAIHAAKEQGLVPQGHHLRHHGRDRGDLVVELMSGDHPGEKYWQERPAAISVPAELGEELPVVRELRRHPERLGVATASRPRALCLVQALAAEAQRRGHEVDVADGDSRGIVLRVRGRSYRLLMSEEYDTVDAPDVDLDDPKIYSWQRIPKRPRAVASGRLTLEIDGDSYRYRGRTRRWADRRRWRLDDKLGEVLSEVQARAELDEQAEIAAERVKAERRRQWEEAVDQARIHHVHANLVQALDEQVQNWNRAQSIRAYLAALEATAAPGERSDALAQWIEWIKDYVDLLDPLLPAPQPPRRVPDPRPEDLRPYLGRWSPYGPESAY
jgi:hypothetical protein